jgi:hypothetical protein
MKERKIVGNSGISFLGLFFLVLFVLKVCGIGAVANWSWWWITAPLWGPIVFGIVAFFLIILLGALFGD